MGNTSVKSKYTEGWEGNLSRAIEEMFTHFQQTQVPSITHWDSHLVTTPTRIVDTYKELFRGYTQTPQEALSTVFQSDTDQMIAQKDISFHSTCAHHALPFFGRCSFAYIPDGRIVGLSKISRLVEVYARRPQVQERLTAQIVEAFMDIVKPKGCGLTMRAYHLCMMARGVEQPTSYTETTALRGNFYEAAVKQEFLQSAQASQTVWK